jgi:site-specific DNA-adenine methylase
MICKEESMKDMQKILLDLFDELDQDIKGIVSEVYLIEREYMDFYKKPRGINEKIRDVIDKYAKFPTEEEKQ